MTFSKKNNNVIQNVLHLSFGRYAYMFSIRLPDELDDQVNQIAEEEQTSKSQVVKEALVQYITDYFSQVSAYEAGKDFFGRHGSGQNNLSTNYKNLIRGKIRAKHTH